MIEPGQTMEVGDALLPFTAHRVELPGGRWTMEGGDDPRRSPRLQALLDHTGGDLDGLRTLDLGCNEGGYAAAFAQLGAGESVGVEGREVNLARARYLKEELGLDHLTLVAGDVKDADAASLGGTFDVVFAAGILYHLDDPYDFLVRARSLTDGLLVLDTHVAERTANAHGLSEIEFRTWGGATYYGRMFREFSPASSIDDVASYRWAALSNPMSFWLLEDQLVWMLRAVGFGYIVKVLVQTPYYCGLGCTTECRVLLLARPAPVALPA